MPKSFINKLTPTEKTIMGFNSYPPLNEYDRIFLCAGVGSRKLAKSIGEFLKIYPVKGYSITVNNPGPNAPKVSLLDDENAYTHFTLGAELSKNNPKTREICKRR